MATALTPLIEEKLPEYPSTIAAPVRKYDSASTYKQPLNPDIVPDEFIQLEKRLTDSSIGQTSTLSHIAAWLAAAKGDFRGLQGIEEAKRQTAIGKKLAPEIRKINELTNKGEWEKAAQYIDTITNTVGPNAKELVPYLQQMAQNINNKQVGWNQLNSLYKIYNKTIPKGHPNRSVVEALGEAVKNRDLWSEGMLSSTMARYAPHTQQIGNRITTTQPMTGAIQSTNLPEMTEGKDTETYSGKTIAAKNGLTTQQLADLLSGTPVKTSRGILIPDSKEAMRIKDEYIAMLPVEARRELVKDIPIDPAIGLQAQEEVGPENTALRNFPPGAVPNILKRQADRITDQKIAETKGTLAADPYRSATAGFEVVGGDLNDASNYLVSQGPKTSNEVRASGGKFIEVNRDILNQQVRPAHATIQSLDSISEMLDGQTLKTRGDKLGTGIVQKLSRYIGYPITEAVEARQVAKTILNSAIEQAENIILNTPQASGRDRQEIAEYKAYASGDFRSERELLAVVDKIRTKLQRVIDRAVPKGESRPQTPAQAIEKVLPTSTEPTSQITKGKKVQQTGQVTRNPYTTDGLISVPAELDAETVERIAEAVKKRQKGGGIRVEVPGAKNPTAPVPTMNQPIPSAEDRVNSGFRKRAIGRMK